MPGGQRAVQKLLCGNGIRGDEPVDAVVGRHDGVQGGGADVGGLVEQVGAVEVQEVEEEHRQRLGRAGGADVDRPSEPGRRHLKAVRAQVGPQRDGLAVGDQVGDGQRQRRLDHLGQPGGHLVEAAGVDGDLVAAAVDLHPGAVELGLENRLTAEPIQGIADTGRGLRQHRPDRPAHPQRKVRQRGGPTGQRRRRDTGQVAAEHGRPAHRGRGNAAGPGDRVRHHPGQRTLPQLAAEQAAQEHLLGFGGRGEEVPDQLRAPGL